jgi:glycosyltransferase involved in cell wall biosynthesis
MPDPKTISLCLSLGSAGHHKNLPETFAQLGILRRAIRYGENVEVFDSDNGRLKPVHRLPGYRLGNRILHAIWRRLPAFAQSTAPMILLSGVADMAVSRWLVSADVFHALAGSALSSVYQAQRLGALTVIDNSFLHPASWEREVTLDCAQIGLDPTRIERFMPPVLIRRLHRQYQACDRIIVYSMAAKRSFDPFPYGSKAVVVVPGVDHRAFTPRKGTRETSTFRVCYVGRIEAPKGLAYLIAAWKQLALANAELVLIGRVFPEMLPLLDDRSVSNIRLTGILSRDAVAACLQESDIFVFPSMNEGMSLAVLEAMSSGVPVIACQATGAEDCIASGETGFLVPGRDIDALAEAILWCYRNREALGPMGHAARTRIEREFTLSDYANRLTLLYTSAVTAGAR